MNVTLPVKLLSYADIEDACRNIEGIAVQTPTLTLPSAYLNAHSTYLKCENLQFGGSFKLRGALNAVSKLTAEQRAKGVITYSSGNHAIAIAIASKHFHVSATIIMPNDAPQTKVATTKSYGANIVFYDRVKGEDREVICKSIQESSGSTLIPPFNHNDVVAGQGTSAKELFESVGPLDYLFVGVGGAGLLAGSALAASELSPNCKVYGVEPLSGNDGQQSFRSGSIVKLDFVPKTIADGAQTQAVGTIPFGVIKECGNVVDILTVSDEELVCCLTYLANVMKIVVEPTGCLALAGAKYSCSELDLSHAKVGIIISGGNVDMDKFASYLHQS